MIKKLLVALLALPLTANAVQWIDLGKSTDKQLQTFIDFDSVKRQKINGGLNLYSSTAKPQYISAIIQSTYINGNPLRKKGLYYSKSQWFISCEDQTYFVKASIDYGFKDEVVNSWQSNKNLLSASDFTYAFPETVGGNNVEYACSIIDLKES